MGYTRLKKSLLVYLKLNFTEHAVFYLVAFILTHTHTHTLEGGVTVSMINIRKLNREAKQFLSAHTAKKLLNLDHP